MKNITQTQCNIKKDDANTMQYWKYDGSITQCDSNTMQNTTQKVIIQHKVDTKVIITLQKTMQNWNQIWHVLTHIEMDDTTTMQIWCKVGCFPLHCKLCHENIFLKIHYHTTRIVTLHPYIVVVYQSWKIPNLFLQYPHDHLMQYCKNLKIINNLSPL